MSAHFKRKLVLVTTIVYLLFACGYVAFCERDNHVINLLSLFSHKITQANNSSLSLKIGKVPGHKPGSVKFLSRPRVVDKKVQVPVFALLTFMVLLIFINAERFCTGNGVITDTLFLPYRRFIVYCACRI
ncbi:MAG: hypothetical protein M3O71_25140 [Bacteroidota bacterium]|nr:hypothetical protein [Bacteroidota bacterium]